ncbi:hypothetical protein DAH51_16845 [Sphingobium yanoikuyae]|uniref:Uncharacterized protein n=1 Tax=Sphingobium yanoikuyae TaxID=13690 RepID=A0A430BRX6_SPHYA|nr:hypothetical protein DAH51_16845 [Sphingobium yanoikuyae]
MIGFVLQALRACLKNRERAIFRYGSSPHPRPTTRQDDTGSGGWAGVRAGTGFLKRALSYHLTRQGDVRAANHPHRHRSDRPQRPGL